MSDHFDKVIEEAEKKLAIQEEAANETRRFINQILEFAGREPRFDPAAVAKGEAGRSAAFTIERNEFYGRPLAYCVREYLKRRAACGKLREATLDEIFEALEQGNYDLRKSGGDRETQRRGVAISLAKNAKVFHKLPNGDFGLTEWYDAVKRSSKSHRVSSVLPDEVDEEEQSEEVALGDDDGTVDDAENDGDEGNGIVNDSNLF